MNTETTTVPLTPSQEMEVQHLLRYWDSTAQDRFDAWLCRRNYCPKCDGKCDTRSIGKGGVSYLRDECYRAGCEWMSGLYIGYKFTPYQAEMAA